MSGLRALRDSTDWQAIPSDVAMVAGYVPPSRFAWPPEAWAKFANSIQIRITPSAYMAEHGVQVLDVEQGDASPAQVPTWCRESRAQGQEPTVYCDFTNWANVIQACLAAGVAMPQFWIALWNGQQNLPTINYNGVVYTAVAHQYANPAASGGDYDASVAAPFWLGVDQGDIMEWSDTTHAPILNPDGSYSGADGASVDYEDLIRFTDASVRWLIEVWVPEVNKALAALSGLSGSASVSVQLTPPPAA